MIKKMRLSALIENLIGWREERGINKHSSAEAQHNCYLEELEEFKDAIGDMAVCLINEQSFYSKDNYFKMLNYVNDLKNLVGSCESLSIDFEECLAIAWHEIKDRVGLMRDTGKFTKWKDLNHDERLQVAASGQLYKKPDSVMTECQKHCDTRQWNEVLSACEQFINKNC